MEEKIKELAKKHNIPAFLLKEVIQMEKEKVVSLPDETQELVTKLAEFESHYRSALIDLIISSVAIAICCTPEP